LKKCRNAGLKKCRKAPLLVDSLAPSRLLTAKSSTSMKKSEMQVPLLPSTNQPSSSRSRSSPAPGRSQASRRQQATIAPGYELLITVGAFLLACVQQAAEWLRLRTRTLTPIQHLMHTKPHLINALLTVTHVYAGNLFPQADRCVCVIVRVFV